MQSEAKELHRGGRSLTDWLHDLVAERPATRRVAGEMLQAMWQGLPEGCSDYDELTPNDLASMEGASERFATAVRSAVVADGFPTADYVDRLIGLCISLSIDWLERCDRVSARNERTDQLLEKSTRRLPAALAIARILRVGCAQCARDEVDFAHAESISAVGMSQALVFRALDVALLESDDALMALLDYEPTRHDAYEALSRIGPPAIRFAPVLLTHLTANYPNHRHEVAAALGSVARGDVPTITAILDLLDHLDSEIRNSAIIALGHMGSELAGQTELVIHRLMVACDDELTSCWAIDALAAVGSNNPQVADRVLAMMAPRPPRIVVQEHNGFRYESDNVMYERGYAIRACAHLKAFSERIVPALVDALDSFVEFNPDEDYYGVQARVCTALTAFGPAAAPAVPRLMMLLSSSNERPQALIQLLKAIVRPAAKMLPRLVALRDDVETPLDPIDDLDAAIMALRS